MNETNNHLGGSAGTSNADMAVLKYLTAKYNIQSMIDVGCGLGEMVAIGNAMGLNAMGIDGDTSLPHNEKIIIHDFTSQPYIPKQEIDLAWSVEFVEHVSHQYLQNFMKTIQYCNVVFMTHAIPNQDGHHHVNCMPFAYWLGVFEMAGFQFQPNESFAIRGLTNNQYIKRTACVFVKNSMVHHYPVRFNNIPKYILNSDIYKYSLWQKLKYAATHKPYLHGRILKKLGL